MKNAEFERLKSDWLFAIDFYLDSDAGNKAVSLLSPEDKIVFLCLLEACMPAEGRLLKNASQELHGWKSKQVHEAWIMYQSQKENDREVDLEKGFSLLQEIAQSEAQSIIQRLTSHEAKQAEQKPTPVIQSNNADVDDDAGRPTLSCVENPDARDRLERYIKRSAIGEASGLRFEAESGSDGALKAIPPGRPEEDVAVRIPKSDPPSFSPYQRESYPEIQINFDESGLGDD